MCAQYVILINAHRDIRWQRLSCINHICRYVPLEAREFDPTTQKASALFVLGLSCSRVQQLSAVVYGQRVARDIGGSDPERTTALKVAE
jgi:hypothetical protein